MNKEWSTSDLSDDELLMLLGDALGLADPVPPVVTEYAKAGFGWRTIDADLAELVFDSATEELVGVRSDDDTRQVTFRAPGVEIEVAVMSEGARRIIGQLVPPQQAEIEMRFDGTSLTTTSDGLGRFTFQDVPTGPISLRCVLEGDQTVQTDWVIV